MMGWVLVSSELAYYAKVRFATAASCSAQARSNIRCHAQPVTGGLQFGRSSNDITSPVASTLLQWFGPQILLQLNFAFYLPR